jgi:hypothetical protein
VQLPIISLEKVKEKEDEEKKGRGREGCHVVVKLQSAYKVEL